MLDLNEMKKRVEEVFRDAERGHESLSIKLVMADLAVPLLQLIEAMEKKQGERWLFLEEVMVRSGWTRNWFEKPLKKYGDRCRLEVWADEKLAEKAPNGFWLISPARVPNPKPGYTSPVGEVGAGAGQDEQENSNGKGPRPDPKDIANRFMGEE